MSPEQLSNNLDSPDSLDSLLRWLKESISDARDNIDTWSEIASSLKSLQEEFGNELSKEQQDLLDQLLDLESAWVTQWNADLYKELLDELSIKDKVDYIQHKEVSSTIDNKIQRHASETSHDVTKNPILAWEKYEKRSCPILWQKREFFLLAHSYYLLPFPDVKSL